MNLTPAFPRGTAIKLLLVLGCLIAMSHPQTVCSRTNSQNSNAAVSGYALANCDQRCVEYSGGGGLYCCTGTSTTTNYDCLYGCNPAQSNNFQWPQAIQPTRCDSYCPPHYYVLSTDPSGTVCKICDAWCLDCNDAGWYYCTSCDAASYRLNSSACYQYTNNTPTNPCLNGYYGLQIQMICAACPTGCSKCAIYLTWEMPGTNFTANYNQNNINCTGDPLCLYNTRCYTCSSGYTLLNGLCYSNGQCLTYSYYTSVGATFNPSSCNCFANYFTLGLSICAKCHIACKTCSGQSSTQCLTCPTGSSNTTTTLPTSCSYNTTYTQIESWVSATPTVTTTVSSSGFYKVGVAPVANVNQMSCTSSAYVFGYYGYNNNGTVYYNNALSAGLNLFPVGAKLVYNKASLVAHYGIHLRATLLFIDQWVNGMSILVQENGKNAFSFTYQMEGIAGEYLCGLNYDDHLDVMDNWFTHTGSSITNLVIKASTDYYAWGIKELTINVLKCHSSCSSCSGSTISDCTGCPANQMVVGGYCVCNSTGGYYNLSNACTTDCMTKYRDPFTYACVTTCSWPFAFGYNNNGTLQCVVSCPSGYYQNYTNSLCVSSCYQSSITNPANNYYKFDGSNRMCNNTCPSGTFGDPQSGACVRICPAYNNLTNDGYFASGSFCYQVCPSTTLFAYVPQRACLSNCPLGYFKNYVTKNSTNASICEQECSITLNGQYLYGDNATGYCTNYCSPGTYGDIDTNFCLSVCNSSAFGQTLTNNVTIVTQRLCVVNCSVANNLFGNPQTGLCVAPSDCPTNYYADPLTSLCTRTCSGNDYYGDNATHKCINTACSNNGFKDNETKICLKTCLHNASLYPEYGDTVTGFCISACYGIYYSDDQYNRQCVTICSASPSSTYGEYNQCVRNCSNITWADVYNPNRTCTNSCLVNSSLISYGLNVTRQCVLYCPDYQFGDISSGIPICAFSCPANPNSSLAGLFGNVLNNLCQQTCPSPFYGDQTGNRTCVRMCPWPYFGQDCTQNNMTFTSSVNRECRLQCTCGWADNVTQLCLWNSTGCAPFTFAHEQNKKCVKSTECNGYGDPVSRHCIESCNKITANFYYAVNDTRMCVLVCPESPDSYGYNNTQQCVLTCPGSSVRDPQGMRRCVNITNCSTTSLFLYGDLDKDLCVTALNCSDGFYGDNITHTCVSICPVLLYADNVTKQCVAVCELGWYALNVSAGSGVCSLKCPQNLWADNLTVTCTPRCSNNTYGVGYNVSWTTFSTSFSYFGICQSQCPDGQFARDLDKVCVIDCGSGLWGDRLSKTCKTSPSDCSLGYYADYKTNFCVVPHDCWYDNITQTQYVADNDTHTCVVKCPSSVHNYADMVKFLCVAQCPWGYYGHNTTLACQPACTYPNASTYDGSFADPQINICVQNCTATPISLFGQYKNYTCVEAIFCPPDTWAEATVYIRTCVNPCPANGTFGGNKQKYGDNITRTCVQTCPTFTFSDLSRGYGLCVNICPNHTNGTLQFADRTTQSCVMVCPLTANYSTFGDNSTVSCVYSCPSGSFAQRVPNRYCVAKCSPGSWGETIKNTCVQSPKLCPTVNGSLYYAENYTAMCVRTCPDPSTFSNTTENITYNSTDGYWGENTTRLCLNSCKLWTNVQSGYKWNKTRVCIKMCPAEITSDGSYSDQGMCYGVCMTANYFRDPQINRSCQPSCSSSPNKQYADNTTMRCLAKCPTYPQQFYAYNPTSTCESTCPNQYRKYEALKTCVQKCPNGTFFNPDTYQCLSVCPLSTSTNKTLFGDLLVPEPICVINSNCSSEYFADTIVGLCVQNCTQGQWKHIRDCVQTCPLGYYGNPNNLTCVIADFCPDNYFADNYTVTCVAECKGTFGNPLTQACVTFCPIDGSHIYYADPITRLCSLTCSNVSSNSSKSLIKNQLDQTCVADCMPGLYMDPLDPFFGSCQPSCSRPYYADNSTRMCVHVCPVSPYLFGENATYTCVKDCLVNSEFKFIEGRVCVTDCPTGTFRDNNTRVCEYTCTGFTYADATSQYCVSNCTPNYAYEPTNECVESCSSPYYRDPTTFKCVLVCPNYPKGYFQMVDNGDRMCGLICPTSPTTQYRDFRTMSCVSKCSASPITFADETTGSCLAVCSLGFFGYTQERTCVPECTGMFADSLTRMCVKKCDPELALFGDSSVSPKACVETCAEGTFADPYTQTCVYNCINSPKMYRFDGDIAKPVRTCVHSCPYPYTADPSTSYCKLECTSLNYPYIDQSLQKCVAKCTTPVYQHAYMPAGQTKNGTCVKFCPNGTFALLTNNSCVAKCPDGLYGSITNNTCTATCTLTDNYYADPYDNLCTAECTHTSTYFSYADEFSRKCVQTCPMAEKGTYGDKLNWKCMKRCSNTAQFADPVSKTCVTQCPSSYFADIVSQTCVSNCSITTLRYGDVSSRVCVSTCLTTTLYADDSTRLCVLSTSCPVGFFGFNTTRVCVASCPTSPNLFGDPVTKTCVSGCQSGYFADYVSRTCVPKCPSIPALYAQNSTKTCVSTCPSNEYADNKTRCCIQVCSVTPDQTFADNTTNLCVRTCPADADYYASNYTWACVSRCPSNPAMYADNSTRSCVYYCPRGIINTYADDSTRRCVDICPGNTYNENKTQQCLSTCLTGYADPKTKFCIAVCPRYTYGDNMTTSCVSGCPVFAGKQTYAEDGNNICMYDCLTFFNTFRDISTKRCVKICPINSSFFADVINRQCVSICPLITGKPPTYADASTRYCVEVCPKIPALFAANLTLGANLYRVCVASCPSGTWSDNNTRTCLPSCETTSPETFGDNSTWSCVMRCPTKPNTYANNDTHICVPVCPSDPDYYGDNITQKCVFYCPNMTFADPVSRRCVTTCPLSYFGQNSTRRCVQECPWKEFADNLTRLCLAKCPVDPILYGNPDNLLCVGQCPDTNSSFGDPLSQQCVNYQVDGTSGCPVTYFADNVSRLCVQVCPMANDTYGDNSTWKCVSQCPIITDATSTYNTYSDNSTMRCVPVCPSYPDFYGEPYSRRCVHFCLPSTPTYSGSFSDNSTRTCVQRCPTTPDYFSDNSTGRCVYYCPRFPLTFADNVTRRCVQQCPIATPIMYGDLKTLRCVTRCPQDQQTFGDITTRLCVLTCPTDPPLYADNYTQTCVPSIQCSHGAFADNSTRRCVKVCPTFPETYGEPNTHACVAVCPPSPSLFAEPSSRLCIPRCPDGLFAQNYTRKCVDTCLYNITNYADNSSNTCVERCPQGLTFGDNQTQRCVFQCPDQPMTYADNITQTCLSICNNVSNGGYADNLTRVCVIKCPDNSYGDVTTRYCVSYCPVGWYAYTVTNLCVKLCPTPWFADNSTWRCVLKCPVGQNLFGSKINNTCVGMCPEGAYASEENQQCVVRCPNNNQTVLKYDTWGFNDTNYCVDECPIVSGVDLYGYPVAQVCVNICPDPYYPNITDHLCYLCPLECASCAYPQACLTCTLDHYLYSGACVQSCPTFPVITYANPNRVCGTAFQCTQGYYALNSSKSCVRNCPGGFYVNIAGQTCDACMKGCISCKVATQCLQCNTNISVWSNNTCYLYCSAKNRFYGTSGCLAQCPTGSFLSITTCKLCDSTCKTCSVTAQNCLICANGLYQLNGICVSTCPTNTTPKLVNGSQSCVSCAITDCKIEPLTFSNTQFATNSQYTVQVQFSSTVNIKDQINNVIKLQQKTLTRRLGTDSADLSYTIVDNGNGLYSFVFNNYSPGSGSQIEVQITNPAAIVGPDGQIPATTRSQMKIDTSLIYSESDYHKGLDLFVYAIVMVCCGLLVLTFSKEHSIWMPAFDYFQLVMVLIFVNCNFPPDMVQTIFSTFAAAFNFLPNFFTTSFSKAAFNPQLINNNIYSVMEDTAFLRVIGHLYFILVVLVAILTLIFIFSKKFPHKQFKKWCKQFIRVTFWKKHLHGLLSLFFLPVFMLGIFNMQLYSYLGTDAIQRFSIFSSFLFMLALLVPIIYMAYRLRMTIKQHPHVYLKIQKAYNFILLQETVLIENKNNCFTHQNNEVDLSNAREPRINEILIFPYPVETKLGPWQITQPFVSYMHKLLTAIFLSMSFSNPVVQIIFLVLINLGYMLYIGIRKPFFSVKHREYNNEIYIHNLLVICIIEIVLLIFVFMNNQLTTSNKVLIGEAVCGLIIEGVIVNVVYLYIRTYNYYHQKTWIPFVRSDIFRINYNYQYLQWTKEYDQKESKLRSQVKPRDQFLQAIRVETGEALANMVRQMSVTTSKKDKLKLPQLRPTKTESISKQYGAIIQSLANDKEKSQKSIASSERLSKMQRKKVRDSIFGEREEKRVEEQYQKLEMIDEKSEININFSNHSEQEDNQTEYEYEFIEEEYPEGTPMEIILQGCKKGDIAMPI